MMSAVLPCDRLDVYRVSLTLVAFTKQVVVGLPGGRAELADQLRRAAFSVTLNIAEGSGEFSPREKSRFYRMALRSATECAAVLDILHQDEALDETRLRHGRELIGRIVAMLTGLVTRASSR